MTTTYALHRALLIARNRTAFHVDDGGIAWAEVGDRIARLAGACAALGLRRGDRVAVLMLNQHRYLELYFACAWAGMVIVPLNSRWAAEENEAAVRDSRASLLVVDSAFAAQGEAIAAGVGDLPLVHGDDTPCPVETPMLDYEQLIAGHRPAEDVRAEAGELAGIFYTGGTTGRSKGVMLSHGNLMANARNFTLEGFSARGIYLSAAPMFHLANAGAMYASFLGGASHAFLRLFTPEALARAIERFRVTDTLLVPTMLQMLVDLPGLEQIDLGALQRILYGASPISEAVLDRAIAALPRTQFIQAYGMTEMSAGVTVLPWEDHLGKGRKAGLHRSAGRPIHFVDVKIVDPEGRTVEPGVVGEIVARGETLMMGYWEQPQETAKAVVDGWMHTGDGGYMNEDGYVFVVDRIKDMIITGGENVYSAEVENIIARHPAVAQCAVIGLPDPMWGERVHAVIMLKPGATLTLDELTGFCREHIAAYKCPRGATIGDVPLPLSGAGKILKRQLRETLGAPSGL